MLSKHTVFHFHTNFREQIVKETAESATRVEKVMMKMYNMEY